ncbi:hypothetical protein IT774_01365 [Salinimonas marina]|uniref:Uncharacterized protein n=1 Tax=Salinimonas marina TaxID=2785918 RepID=A0A7S9DXV1_9ALTE|nr:hypothetical protein [Salinimonas marina]QPG05939.1 hypothetical protein IT774_01365 [Salinimonas marina]
MTGSFNEYIAGPGRYNTQMSACVMAGCRQSQLTIVSLPGHSISEVRLKIDATSHP